MALPLVAAAPAIGSAALSVGKRIFKYVESNPELKDKTLQLLNRSRGSKPLNDLIESKDKNVQRGVVKAALDAGLSVDVFMKQLTREEAAEYAQLIVSYKMSQTDMVDAAQAPRASTGDEFLDKAVVNKEIRTICGALGVSSDTYGLLLRGINTHTSKDIERFQLSRRIDNLPPI